MCHKVDISNRENKPMTLTAWVGRDFFFSETPKCVFYKVAHTADGVEQCRWSDDSELLRVNPTV